MGLQEGQHLGCEQLGGGVHRCMTLVGHDGDLRSPAEPACTTSPACLKGSGCRRARERASAREAPGIDPRRTCTRGAHVPPGGSFRLLRVAPPKAGSERSSSTWPGGRPATSCMKRATSASSSPSKQRLEPLDGLRRRLHESQGAARAARGHGPVREQRRLERANATVGVPEHAHVRSRPLDRGGDVFELSLERVALGIAASTPTPRPVHRQHGVARVERGEHGCPAGVVSRGTTNQEKGLPLTASSDRDRGPVLGDDALGLSILRRRHSNGSLGGLGGTGLVAGVPLVVVRQGRRECPYQ
jgi:hypothetical protein